MVDEPPWVEGFVHALKERITEIRRRHLAPLESGNMKILKGGKDVTNQEIESLRQNIASIEAVLAQYRPRS
jgi:hypothetical protein